MEPEEIKLGECASCHKVTKVHKIYISCYSYAFICNDCENEWLNSLKAFLESNPLIKSQKNSSS